MSIVGSWNLVEIGAPTLLGWTTLSDYKHGTPSSLPSAPCDISMYILSVIWTHVELYAMVVHPTNKQLYFVSNGPPRPLL